MKHCIIYTATCFDIFMSSSYYNILFFIITNKCTINTITVYITRVSLCDLYCYMFRHFHVIIIIFILYHIIFYYNQQMHN